MNTIFNIKTSSIAIIDYEFSETKLIALKALCPYFEDNKYVGSFRTYPCTGIVPRSVVSYDLVVIPRSVTDQIEQFLKKIHFIAHKVNVVTLNNIVNSTNWVHNSIID